MFFLRMKKNPTVSKSHTFYLFHYKKLLPMYGFEYDKDFLENENKSLKVPK